MRRRRPWILGCVAGLVLVLLCALCAGSAVLLAGAAPSTLNRLFTIAVCGRDKVIWHLEGDPQCVTPEEAEERRRRGDVPPGGAWPSPDG